MNNFFKNTFQSVTHVSTSIFQGLFKNIVFRSLVIKSFGLFQIFFYHSIIFFMGTRPAPARGAALLMPGYGCTPSYLDSDIILVNRMVTLQSVICIQSRARSLYRQWSCSSRTLGDDMLADRCLALNSYLIDNFTVHLTTNIGDVKLSTNVVYGRNALS